MSEDGSNSMSADEYNDIFSDEQNKEKFIQNKDEESFQEEDYSQIEEIDESLESSDLKGIRRPNQSKSLTERDLIRRTASIFESAKDCKVVLTYDGRGSGNWVAKGRVDEDGKQTYTVNLESPAIKGIPKYTGANHEFGHLAFDSLIGQTCMEYFRRQIPPQVKEEHKMHAFEMYGMASNVLEDERMESLMGDLYAGTGKRFKEYKKKIGKGYGEKQVVNQWKQEEREKAECGKAINPVQAILYERFGRSDLVPKKWQKICKECIEDVRMTGREGTITVGDKFISEVLNPWILENGQESSKSPNGKGKGNGKGEGKMQKSGDMAKQFNDKCDHKGLGNPPETIEKPKSLNEVKKEGQKEVDNLKEKIDENNRKAQTKRNTMPPDCGVIKYIDRHDKNIKIEYNARVAQSLNRIFRELQAKTRYKLHEDGDMLDMSAVIRRKARGFGNVFKKRRIKSDLTLCVSVDVSGSMNGQPVAEARKMSATIFKAIEGISGINFHTFAWNGGNGRLDISEIHRYNDVRSINCEGLGGTPTPEAMAYSVSRLKEMGGKNKVLIFITDGSPNNGMTGCKSVKKWVKIARNEGINVIGVYSGGTSYYGSEENWAMTEMFGKGNYMVYEDMNKSSASVISKFKQFAVKAVRK